MFSSFVLFLADAAPTTTQGGGAQESMMPFILKMGALFIILYFVMIYPQQKRQKAQAEEQRKRMEALKTGDSVLLACGLHGMVSNVKETTVMIKVADNVKLEFEKSAVTSVDKPKETSAA